MAYGLSGVCLNITHTYDSDLMVGLVSPDNTRDTLFSRIGGGDSNFVGTCLAMNGQFRILNARPPFTGVFIPFGSLNKFNTGSNPNGIWRLFIKDMSPVDEGVLNDYSLTFSDNPPTDPAGPRAPCGMANPLGCACPDGSDTCDLLPDMTASALILSTDVVETRGLLKVGNATPNIGWGPLEIHGTRECFCDTIRVPCTTTVCPNGSPVRERVIQTIYRREGDRIVTRERNAGYMAYHPTHGHVHVENWASYTLRSKTLNPDATTWPIVATGEKVSYCLVNLGDCDRNNGYCRDSTGRLLTKDSIPNSGFGTVTGCSRDQGIYVGSLDIYSSQLDGQQINLNGLCNGTYYIVSITDPDNQILETDDRNNWVAVPVQLTQQRSTLPVDYSLTASGSAVAFYSPSITAGIKFKWEFGDGAIDTVNNPAVHTYAAFRGYTSTLTISTSCARNSISKRVTVVASKDYQAPETFALRAVPNPSAGQVAAEYVLQGTSSVKIAVMNMLGQTVFASSLVGKQGAGKHSTALDLKAAGLSAGMYTLLVLTENGSASQKLVIE